MRRLCVFVVLSLLFTPAVFAEPTARKFDFTQIMKDQDGSDMWECVEYNDKEQRECKARKAVSLGAVVFKALSAPEQNIPLEESFKRGKLAMEIYKGKDVSLSAEDIVLVKKQVAKVFGPIVVYRVVQILDPEGK